MTAIGVALLFLFGVLFLIYDGQVFIEWLGGFALIVGATLTAAGVLTWLWRVMP